MGGGNTGGVEGGGCIFLLGPFSPSQSQASNSEDISPLSYCRFRSASLPRNFGIRVIAQQLEFAPRPFDRTFAAESFNSKKMAAFPELLQRSVRCVRPIHRRNIFPGAFCPNPSIV